MKVSYVYHPLYLEHDTGDHVENARRLEAILAHLEKTGIKQRLNLISPRPATKAELALVHSESHIAHIEKAAKDGGGWLDLDTVMSAKSYEAALYAAGGLINATEEVIREGGRAFALLRPPGHHATPNQAMGFCLFNNVAVAAESARTKSGIERLAIIDFDVHHGNGTQDAFYDNPDVLYISTHQTPLYPGTGGIRETGSGEAEGTTVNIPLPPGSGDKEYLEFFGEIVSPLVTRFRPGLIMVSAGYDGHRADGLANMQLSTGGFARLTGVLTGLADQLCDGRLVFALEGGYNLEALAASVGATFEVLLGESNISDPLGQPSRRLPPPDLSDIVREIKQAHNLS